MRIPIANSQFLGFFPPYRTLEVLSHPRQFPGSPLPTRGAALIWNTYAGDLASGLRAIRERPPGVALLIILPPTSQLDATDTLLELMEGCRPHSVLPHMKEVACEELVAVLRRFPAQFDIEVVDYLVWRGIDVDLDTRRLLRKTFDLSGELRTVSGLARALYLSRRALGRRFMTRGLPVPSHWLHFGRVLRASIRMQAPESSLFAIGCDLGYPDGFALSNQLYRLSGLRPSMMKECFGWEWVVESWLFREAQEGNLSPALRQKLFPTTVEGQEKAQSAAMAGASGPAGKTSLQVAEKAPGGRRGSTRIRRS